MAGRMWFGTRGYMQWVAACAVDPDFSKVGWSTQFQLLNGGAAVRASSGSHKEYSMSWNILERAEARRIIDYSDGVYDTQDGTNLIYFVDPNAMDTNVLPQLWATPAQSYNDGFTLTPGAYPTLTTTPANTNGYPARSAVYKANVSSNTLWVPIPPGYTLWVGAHGSAVGAAGVVVTPTTGLASGTPTVLTMLPVTSTTRVNYSVASTAADGALVSFNNVSDLSTDTMTLAGIIAQLLPTGSTPETGQFISGQGNSGCQFAEKPSQTPRSAALNRVSLSAKLVETGSWL